MIEGQWAFKSYRTYSGDQSPYLESDLVSLVRFPTCFQQFSLEQVGFDVSLKRNVSTPYEI
jgi:hypothetical protein